MKVKSLVIHSTKKSVKNITLVLLITLMLGGCSARFVYNQLDWLVPWYLEDYVTLENYQHTHFEEALDTLLVWHRKTQLNQYASWFSQIAQEAESPTNDAQMEKHFERLEGFIDGLFLKFGESFAPLLAKMTPEQQAELMANLTEKNQSYYEDSVQIGEQASKAEKAEKVKAFLDDWLGELTSKQEKMVDDWFVESVWLAPEFYKNRLAWQQHLKEVFMRYSDKNTKKTPDLNAMKTQEIIAIFKDRRQFWAADLAQKFAINQQFAAVFIANLLNSLSAEQRASLVAELKDYEQDFRILAMQ